MFGRKYLIWVAAVAVLAALHLFVSACGDDDDDGATRAFSDDDDSTAFTSDDDDDDNADDDDDDTADDDTADDDDTVDDDDTADDDTADDDTGDDDTFVENYGLDFDVTDAEYSRFLDRAVIAAHHPTNAVVTLDFETNAASSVALDEKPISISVSPDGKHAAVNHGDLISYVDLVEMKVEDTFTPTKDLGDIVLAQDYIYGFPTLDGWTRIVCIKISDGTETLHTGSKDIRQQSKAKLHPNLDWLYTTEVENWPRGISKFSVTTGTAAYLYDEPKHGEYNFCAKIWIAPDGKRLYTRCMHIFTSTDDQETDIGYIGDLTEDGADELTELDVSPASDGAIVAILDKAVGSPYNSRDIMAFDPDLLTKTRHWKLPLYEGESNDYEINGDYVFVSNDGTRAYVIAMVADDAFAPADKDQQTFVFDLE